MHEITEEQVTFACGEDRCEGVLAYGAHSEGRHPVLLLCPHPLLGGNMQNNLILHLARRIAEDGGVSLRFNYRGVGGSTLGGKSGASHFDYFREVEKEQRYEAFLPEVMSAARFLQESLCTEASPPFVELTLLGYSLGVLLAGLAARQLPLSRIIAVGPPNAKANTSLFADCTLPKTFLAGEGDVFFAKEAFEAEFAGYPPPKRLTLLPEADHFFRGDEELVYAHLRADLVPRADASEPKLHIVPTKRDR